MGTKLERSPRRQRSFFDAAAGFFFSSGAFAPKSPGIEKRANAFAAYLLMPGALVLKHLQDANHIEKEDVRRLASRLQVNDSALLPHLQNLDLIDAERRGQLRDES